METPRPGPEEPKRMFDTQHLMHYPPIKDERGGIANLPTQPGSDEVPYPTISVEYTHEDLPDVVDEGMAETFRIIVNEDTTIEDVLLLMDEAPDFLRRFKQAESSPNDAADAI